MSAKKELLAMCGLYCGVCGVLIATQDDNQKFRERLSTVYGCSPEEIKCEGCLSDVKFKLCVTCPIRACARLKDYESCAQCDQFPCMLIDNFPLPVGKKVILRAVPAWRELGTEKWVEEEEKRYHCPKCGSKTFRGAKRCRECGETISLD